MAEIKKEYLMGFLAVLAVFGFLGSLGMLVFGKEIPQANREYFALGFGALIGVATMIYQFFFGSSKSSSEKNALLAGKEPGGEPPAPPAG